jgi:hypothetical protein
MDCKRCRNFEPVCKIASVTVDLRDEGITPGTNELQCYRSEDQPYDVELSRDGATVTAQVWDMPEEVRSTVYFNAESLIEDDENYIVKSVKKPEIYVTHNIAKQILFLRGIEKEHDNDTAAYTFPTPAAARKYFQHITALLDKLNAEHKPPFDEAKIFKLAKEYAWQQYRIGFKAHAEFHQLDDDHLPFLTNVREDAAEALAALLTALGLDA